MSLVALSIKCFFLAGSCFLKMHNREAYLKVKLVFWVNHSLALLHSLSLLHTLPLHLPVWPHTQTHTHTHTHTHVCMFTLLESCTLNATLTLFCHSSQSGVNYATFQHAGRRIITDTLPEPGTPHHMTPSYSPLESHLTTFM